ncbi:hypothetical protein M422DRAFT_251278 [Sphaerobolus stellatus SS14]|uniref:ABC transporter domain-containing protein n=1 Tax=Sphaerobolus stellatus (strain SS14) TaxID=990650 RepID=A0A0C9W273_SPHS4|nr:hypothetical protein M422DRAFT_251278 [Sphaerobolus stellatus SS14]
MSHKRNFPLVESTIDEPFNPDADYVRHTRIGVWDFYEDLRHASSVGKSWKIVERFEETLVSLPYVTRTIRTILSLSFPVMALYCMATLVTSLMPAAAIHYSGQLLFVVQEAIESRTVDKSVLFHVLFYRIMCTVVTRFANLAQNWAAIRIAARMRTHYTEHILLAHIRLDLPTYGDPSVRGQLNSVVSSRSNVAWVGIRSIISTISTIIQLVSQVSVLINILKDQPDSILLALVSFADPIWSWFRRSSQWRGGVWAATCRNIDYIRIQGLKALVDGDHYRKELIAGNIEEYVVNQFMAAQGRIGEDGDLSFHEAQQEMHQRRETFSPLSFLHNVLGELPQVVFTLRAVQSPRSIPVSLTSLTIIRQAVGAFTGPLISLLSQTASISDTFASIRQLYEIINIENQVKDGTKPFPENAAKVKSGISIEFRNVSFKYPGVEGDRYAIKDVSFKIDAGQLCVIVGFNGSGKSTILKLLNRLYDPTDGTIFIDGQDIKTLKLADLRRCISVLFQDYTHFPLSIKENIGIGDPLHADDEDRIRQAAELGGAIDIIEGLPEGFDTFLQRPVRDYYSGIPAGNRGQSLFGRSVDFTKVKRRVGKTQQIELSGGQMQKLAVSRTFMRSLGDDSGVGLLLFDEPSASLDPTAEHDLFERLRKLRGSKTMVFSSHRFGQLTKSADLILYMGSSTVLEQGTHTELVKQEGGYAKMYDLQASAFR